MEYDKPNQAQHCCGAFLGLEPQAQHGPGIRAVSGSGLFVYYLCIVWAWDVQRVKSLPLKHTSWR